MSGWAAFWAGHWPYVWGAWGFAALTLLWLWLTARRRHRRLLRRLRGAAPD